MRRALLVAIVIIGVVLAAVTFERLFVVRRGPASIIIVRNATNTEIPSA